MVRLFELVTDTTHAGEVDQFLGQWLPRNAIWQTAKGSGRFLIWSNDPASANCLAAERAEAFCLTCPLAAAPMEDGKAPWSLILPHRPHAPGRSPENFEAGKLAGPVGSVRGIHPYTDEILLTPRQEKAIAAAVSLGYFDFPRRASLGQVARSLGVGRSTAQEHLRRGLAKILVQRGRIGTSLHPLE